MQHVVDFRVVYTVGVGWCVGGEEGEGGGGEREGGSRGGRGEEGEGGGEGGEEGREERGRGKADRCNQKAWEARPHKFKACSSRGKLCMCVCVSFYERQVPSSQAASCISVFTGLPETIRSRGVVQRWRCCWFVDCSCFCPATSGSNMKLVNS